MKKSIFVPKKNFIKYFAICSFIDFYYELISYKHDMAQIGSAGALGVTEYTNRMNCNKYITLNYLKSFSES